MFVLIIAELLFSHENKHCSLRQSWSCLGVGKLLNFSLQFWYWWPCFYLLSYVFNGFICLLLISWGQNLVGSMEMKLFTRLVSLLELQATKVLRINDYTCCLFNLVFLSDLSVHTIYIWWLMKLISCKVLFSHMMNGSHIGRERFWKPSLTVRYWLWIHSMDGINTNLKLWTKLHWNLNLFWTTLSYIWTNFLKL